MCKISDYIENVLKPEYTMNLPDTFFKYKIIDGREYGGQSRDVRITYGFGPRLRYTEFITVTPGKYQQKNCIHCGVLYESKVSYGKYCSPECSRGHHSASRVNKSCEYCGKSFQTRTKAKKFCDIRCAKNASKDRLILGTKND